MYFLLALIASAVIATISLERLFVALVLDQRSYIGERLESLRREALIRIAWTRFAYHRRRRHAKRRGEIV